MPGQKYPIAVLGLGSMGASLARHLLKSNYQLHIWNRTSNRPAVQELSSNGAEFSASPAKALAPCRIVVICVLDYSTVYEIFENVGTAGLKGKTVINLTNSTPKDARIMSASLYENYAVSAYLDAAIMATPALVGTEAAFLFCSGVNEQTFHKSLGGQSASDILSVFGRVDYLGPDPGAASLYDLALLSGMYGMFGGVFTAIGLLSRRSKNTPAQNDPAAQAEETASEVIATKLSPMLQALLPSLVGIATVIENEDDAPYDHPNTMQYHGLKNIVQACEEEGVDGGPLKHLLSVFGAVEEEGGGGRGMGLIGRKFLR